MVDEPWTLEPDCLGSNRTHNLPLCCFAFLWLSFFSCIKGMQITVCFSPRWENVGKACVQSLWNSPDPREVFALNSPPAFVWHLESSTGQYVFLKLTGINWNLFLHLYKNNYFYLPPATGFWGLPQVTHIKVPGILPGTWLVPNKLYYYLLLIWVSASFSAKWAVSGSLLVW